MALTQLEAALLSAAADSAPLDQEPSAMAQAVADAASTTFTPSDCVETEVVGASVTYTFENCSGPRGLAELSGAANLIFSVEGMDSVSVTLTATDLDVNDASMTLNANGAYSLREGTSELDLTTSGGGTTADGTLLGRVGSYIATWDADCVSIDGQWTTSINDAFWSTGVQGYTRCGSACPESGTIGYLGIDSADSPADPLDGSGIVITFDGDDTARFITPRGATGEVTLDCSAS
jgi:hypothetical protein